MKAEFLKDDNGNIWFFYASNIQVRPRYRGAAAAAQMNAGLQGGGSLIQDSKSKN
jgi:hypothetical protein